MALRATVLLLLVMAAPAFAQANEDERARVDSNLKNAREALKKKAFDDVRLSALAVLKINVEQQEALVMLAEAYSAQQKNDLALCAALAGYDAPKRVSKDAAALTTRSMKILTASAPSLVEFLNLRALTANTLLKVAAKPQKEKRQFDCDWLKARASEVAPTQDEVEKALGNAKPAPRRWHAAYGDFNREQAPKSGTSAPKGEAGFVDLMGDRDNWKWADRTEGSAFKDTEIVFGKKEGSFMVQINRVDDAGKVGGSFTLKISMKFELLENADPRLFVMFRDSKLASGSALIIMPQGVTKALGPGDKPRDPGITFAECTPDSWNLKFAQRIAADKIKPGQWYEIVIAWDSDAEKVTFSSNGETLFDQKLAKQTVEGYIGFGFGNMESAAVKDVRLKKK